MKNKYIIGALALAAVLTIGVSSTYAQVGQRDGQDSRNENREEIHEAFENNDYQTFKEITSDAPFSDQITEEIFEKIAEAHELRQSGDHEGAKGIMESLGIDLPHKGHKGIIKNGEFRLPRK